MILLGIEVGYFLLQWQGYVFSVAHFSTFFPKKCLTIDGKIVNSQCNK